MAIRVDSIRSPEAFVNEILPRQIFVTTSIFETFMLNKPIGASPGRDYVLKWMVLQII